MLAIHDCVQALECFIRRSGLALTRARLPEAVHARLMPGRVLVRPRLAGTQHLRALVHEAAHWLAHSRERSPMHPTVYEYEAEAIERLVLHRLGFVAGLAPDDDWHEEPTDGLLPASLARVRSTSDRIVEAIHSARSEA